VLYAHYHVCVSIETVLLSSVVGVKNLCRTNLLNATRTTAVVEVNNAKLVQSSGLKAPTAIHLLLSYQEAATANNRGVCAKHAAISLIILACGELYRLPSSIGPKLRQLYSVVLT
jgi:hypothetical protein